MLKNLFKYVLFTSSYVDRIETHHLGHISHHFTIQSAKTFDL